MEHDRSRWGTNKLSDEKVLSETARESLLSFDFAELFFGKEILVKPLELDPAADTDAHAIFDH